MFGRMKTQPIITVSKSSAETAVEALLIATENAEPVRWIEFPTSILLLAAVPGDAASGAHYLALGRFRR